MKSGCLSFYLKKSIPFLCCLFFLFLSQTVSFFITTIPACFILIFYFSIFRPQLLNDYMVFILGVCYDLFSCTPLGLWAFICTFFFFVCHFNRLFLSTLTFGKLWFAFSLITLFSMILYLLIFSALMGDFIFNIFLLIEYCILNLMYPLGIFLCGRLDKWIEVER